MPPDLREDVGRRRISQPAREVPEMSSLPPAAQRPPVRANERFQAHAANLLGHDTEAIFTYLHRTAPETDTAADTAELLRRGNSPPPRRDPAPPPPPPPRGGPRPPAPPPPPGTPPNPRGNLPPTT